MAKWISVDDRLPEDESNVIVCYGFKDSITGKMYIGTGYYCCHDEKPHWNDSKYGVFVTHWMPLPEPPKGCENNVY